MLRRTVKLTVLFIIVLCFTMSPAIAKEKPLKIGSIFPLTGTCAKPGMGCKYALELAFDEINENGGIHGRPLKLNIEDDEGQPTVSVGAAEKLCVQDQVLAVIGPFNSSCCLAHMQVTEREKTPQVVPVAFASAITRPFDNPWIFRNLLNAATIGSLFADFIAEESKAKKFVFIRENTDYGLDFERLIGSRLKALGAKTDTIVYNPGDTDFYTHLTKMKNMKPDAAIMISNIAESSQLMKQAGDLDIKMPFFATGSSATQQFISLAGKAGEGLYSLSFTEVMPDDPPIKKAFIKNYNKRFGITPDMFAIATYDAAYIVAEGLKNAYRNNGNNWPKKVSDFRTKLRDGIKEIDGLQLCQGKIIWNKYQESGTNLQFIQWQGGKKIVIKALKSEDCILPGE